MTLIDTHCHLNYDYSPKTADDLVREALDAGIEALVTIGVDLTTQAEVQAISDRFQQVYHTVGVHPHEAVTLNKDGIDALRRAAAHPKCRAIGEIGLDYHYEHSPRDIQTQALEQQLELALSLQQPVVIHSRDAEADLLPRLKAYAERVSQSEPVGIIHCFSGTEEFGEACIALGFLISLSGIITFKNADSLRECARKFPLDRILVETDSPYLAPIPFRGKKCEPSMVKLTAQKIAEVRGIALELVEQATTESARRFFRLR